MTIKSHSYTLANLLLQGTFEPAPVQREYQWQALHVRQLLEDILGAFQRSGADPGPLLPGRNDGEELTAASSPAAATDELPQSASPATPPDAQPAADAAAEDEPSETDNDAAETPALDGERVLDARALPAPRRPADSYYLGGLILLPAPRKSRHFFVYDGLQRLTTLTLLLARLREGWGEHAAAEQRRLRNMLTTKPTQTEASEPRLAMPTPGATLVWEVKRSGSRRKRNLSLGDWRMREAADYFGRAFSGWSDLRRAALLRFLSERVVFTITKVDNASLAYQMFVAANARGLALEVGDILKGQLVDQANRGGGLAVQIAAIAGSWRQGQRQLRKSFADFIAALEVMKFRPSNRHAPGELLMNHFQNHSADQIEAWVNGEFTELVDAFQLSRQHLIPPTASGVDLAFRRLSFIGWKEWQPFYLALALAHKEHGDPRWLQLIRQLQRACYIIELINWSERARRRRFLTALHQLERGHDPFRRQLPDGETGALYLDHPKLLRAARLGLRTPLVSDEKRGAVVRYVETLHWGQGLPRYATDDASIEHVLPRTPIGDWQRDFSDEERERLTNRLGNLCLIPKHVNDAVGNMEWPLKEAEFAKLGDRYRGVLLVLKAAEFVAGSGEPTQWNALAVEQLTEHLASLAETALGIAPRR